MIPIPKIGITKGKYMKRVFGVFAGVSAILISSTAQADNGKIMEGLVDIPRLAETAPLDGCSKVNKGLVNSGGLLVFTCEKLLPYLPISEHAASFSKYQSILQADGWRRKSGNQKTARFFKTDAFGCHTRLDVMLWTDRSMNETPKRASTDREAHRQIVFKAKFSGAACERYYDIATAMAGR